jgi:hypothetical protein
MIGDMILSMEGFTFATPLDSSMGYYHIKLDADADADVNAQKLCTFVLPWGKYIYNHLPMGIKVAIFPMFFKISCLSWVSPKIWNMLRPILMMYLYKATTTPKTTYLS